MILDKANLIWLMDSLTLGLKGVDCNCFKVDIEIIGLDPTFLLQGESFRQIIKQAADKQKDTKHG